MIVYLPILTLEGVEGKLFRPMALTVIFALLGSMVLSLTLMPVLASLLCPRRAAATETTWCARLRSGYRPALARRAAGLAPGASRRSRSCCSAAAFMATRLGPSSCRGCARGPW
jgi:cobalt-zinc-cadmium resistance protein CzcA